MVLTFAGKGKEGFIRFNDTLQVFDLSGRRQRQEPMAPTETGTFVDSALLGARTYGQACNQRHAVIQPLFLMPQTGQRRSRYCCECVLARATAKTLQPRLATPTIESIRLADRANRFKKILKPLHRRRFWRHFAKTMPNLFLLFTAKLRYFFQPLPKIGDFHDYALQL
jgi:hypothetical protein